MAASARVQQIVALVAELSADERLELAAEIARLECAAGADPKRARVADAIQRVVRDHPGVLSALAK